jgi:hypothetical protein
MGHQCPGYACHPVGKRHRDQHPWFPGEHAPEPGAGRCSMSSCPVDHGAGTDDEETTEISCPILDVRPSRVLPPVEVCLGVSPIHAARSRPRSKLSIGGAKAVNAVAITGPMPGMVMGRLATSSFLARCLISRSRSSIRCDRSRITPTRSRSIARTGSGRLLALSSSNPANRPTWEMSFGAMRPNSAIWPRRALIVLLRWRTRRSRALKVVADACCASLLTATKRMVGRCAASQIASASAMSFFCRLITGPRPAGYISSMDASSPLVVQRRQLGTSGSWSRMRARMSAR